MRGHLLTNAPAVRRPWPVLWAALGVGLVLALAGFGSQGRFSNGGYIADGTEAVRAERMLAQRFDAGIPDIVLRVRAERPATDPRVAAAGTRFAERAARQPGVRRVLSYWTVGDPRLLSRDGRTALVTLDLRGGEHEAARRATSLVPRLTGAQGPFRITATGRPGSWPRPPN
ncbi:hypothetical protein ACOBQB_37285 [Streptomyces sp. G5(2025)]|uniref:hypothetical protein n=1 Tax=Streptomyces sp. G5(2025) TaxID=3406628 RepID=UPI003C1C8276